MKRKWAQKCEVNGKNLPIPTQIVSNEEFAPPDQTDEQKRVEHRLIEIASENSKNSAFRAGDFWRLQAEWRRLFSP